MGWKVVLRAGDKNAKGCKEKALKSRRLLFAKKDSSTRKNPAFSCGVLQEESLRAGSPSKIYTLLLGCCGSLVEGDRALRGDAHGAEGLALVAFDKGSEKAEAVTGLVVLEGFDATLDVGQDGGGALGALDFGDGEGFAVDVGADFHVIEKGSGDVVEFRLSCSFHKEGFETGGNFREALKRLFW